MLVSFNLTMPKVGSWDGKWSGAGRNYTLVRRIPKNVIEAKMPVDFLTRGAVWHYDFGDGWVARVSASVVPNAREANRMRKSSAGFCGYEWMVSDIINTGKVKGNAPVL